MTFSRQLPHITRAAVFEKTLVDFQRDSMKKLTKILIKEYLSTQYTRFFYIFIQFTLFRTKSLQSPGTYISKRT